MFLTYLSTQIFKLWSYLWEGSLHLNKIEYTHVNTKMHMHIRMSSYKLTQFMTPFAVIYFVYHLARLAFMFSLAETIGSLDLLYKHYYNLPIL